MSHRDESSWCGVLRHTCANALVGKSRRTDELLFAPIPYRTLGRRALYPRGFSLGATLR